MEVKKSSTFKVIRMNFVEKITNLVLGVVRVPVLLNYLSLEKYGFWVLLTTIGSWFTMSDFGFGSSLKNKISSLKAEDRNAEIKSAIAYCFTILSIFCLLSFIFILILVKSNLFLKLWGNYNLTSREINLSVIIFALVYFPLLPLSIARNIYYIYNKGHIYSLAVSIDNVLSIAILYILVYLKQPIYVLLFFYFFIDLVFQMFMLLYFMYIEFHSLKVLTNPLIHNNLDIIHVGMKYFILQLVSLVINQTDNVIIERYAGMSYVAIYSVCIQLYNIGLILVNVLSESLWTNYVNLYNSKAYAKLREQFNKHKMFSFLYGFFGAVIYISFAKPVIRIWTDSKINPSFILIIIIGLLFLAKALNSPLVTFLNSLSLLDKQLLPSVINAVLNIILSIILIKFMGISGVALGTVIPFVIFSLGVNWFLVLKAKAA